MVNARLSEAALPHGLYYAPDPSSQSACTLGGNVAENAGGPHCLKYGVTTNHVAALEVLLPNAELVRLGSRSGEAWGPDLVGLFVGSEGMFGIATEITLRLEPLPAAVRTLLAAFPSIRAASEAVSGIIAAGIVPAAMEMMDQACVRAVEASIYAAGYPTDAAAVLLVEVDGSPEAVAGGGRAGRGAPPAAPRHGGPHRHHAPRSGRGSGRGGRRRSAPWAGSPPTSPCRTPSCRGARCPTSSTGWPRSPRTTGSAWPMSSTPATATCTRTSASTAAIPDQVRRVHAANHDIMHACLAVGGSITGEHGVGSDKLAYMPDAFDAETLGAMRAVRQVFDPSARANPGKVIPYHACREWRRGGAV